MDLLVASALYTHTYSLQVITGEILVSVQQVQLYSSPFTHLPATIVLSCMPYLCTCTLLGTHWIFHISRQPMCRSAIFIIGRRHCLVGRPRSHQHNICRAGIPINVTLVVGGVSLSIFRRVQMPHKPLLSGVSGSTGARGLRGLKYCATAETAGRLLRRHRTAFRRPRPHGTP